MEMAGNYTREDYYDQNQGYQAHVHTFGFDTWWKNAVADTWNYWDYRACSIDCWRNYKPSGTILIPLVIIMLIIRLIGGSGRRW